jgi:hypothetical protein
MSTLSLLMECERWVYAGGKLPKCCLALTVPALCRVLLSYQQGAPQEDPSWQDQLTADTHESYALKYT